MIKDIIRREGGFVNHPNDRGGPTKYGITQKTLSNYRKHEVTIDDVRDMKTDEAEAIYAKNFYQQPHIDKLPEELQPFVFDSAAHHGPYTAITFLQRACGVIEDGICGPRTRAAAAVGNSCGLLRDMIGIRRQFFHAIVTEDPTQAVFLTGWLNRLKEFTE
ncbi:MAG: glycosyl hydrolase 108 family protein [Nitrosomonadaceae bacterium]